MINYIANVFCGTFRDGLYLLTNYWILMFLGVALLVLFLVLFGPLLSRFVLSGLGYVIWRISGALGRTLRFKGKKSVWQYFELSNPYALAVGSRGRFLTNLTLIPGQTESSQNIVLGDSIELIRPDSIPVQTNALLQNVDIEIEKFFPVNPKRICRGCHGRYSLAKSLYLGRTFGGDPICGGGLTHFTPPRWQQVMESMRFRRLLKNKTVPAFVFKDNLDGSSGVFYKETWDEKIPMGYLRFFVGDEAMIHQYAERQKITIKPVQIVFA